MSFPPAKSAPEATPAGTPAAPPLNSVTPRSAKTGAGVSARTGPETNDTPDTGPGQDAPRSSRRGIDAAPHKGAALSELSGWGRTPRVQCELREPETPGALRRMVDPAGTAARGLGSSYGDPAQNAGGRVVGLRNLDRYLGLDTEAAVLSCEAGVTLEQIIDTLTPRGFFPLITPGTKYVTVGGCIANDVHGKAHHVQGSFSNSVESMDILLASGEVVTASREQNPDLFWGTFGGMGLLGLVLRVRLRLRKVETAYFHTRAIVANNLEEMLAALDEYDQQYPYSVAILDPVATGARLGRGVLTVGDHAALSDLPPELAREPLRVAGRPRLTVPFDLPELCLNPITIRILAVAMRVLQTRPAAFAHYQKFFYPLDMIVNGWNRAYGRRGFTQYQFVIPFDNGPAHLREILGAIMSSGQLPFLNVLKRLGDAGEGVLSFPRAGYTFAIDFPMRKDTVEVLHRIDRMVLDAGGRIYLGKDVCLEADMFRAMYGSAVDHFLELKAKYDPDNVFTSDQARRLGLA